MDKEKEEICKEENLTLGSLFDGSGGFPLAGLYSNIQPTWASEIEPFPIAVTKTRLPFMKHYGDVTKINGAEIEPVDIISFGSPCFPAGTKIMTEDGVKNIEDIQVGDVVYTHMGRWNKVTDVGCTESETVILHGDTCDLECTPNHPILSLNLGALTDSCGYTEWVEAKDMACKLYAMPTCVGVTCSYEPIKVDFLHYWYYVKSVEWTRQSKIVYNMTVDEDNSYVADGVVVHNCQDMSVAGKRVGLDGERSGLFHHAIRIIGEMRNATNNLYPKYAVWENVCFAKGTFVTCENGYKNIEDVNIGDKVKTLSGNYCTIVQNHRIRNCQTMVIKTRGSEDLIVTQNHKFWVRQKTIDSERRRIFSQPMWIKAEDLTTNHMVGYKIDCPSLPDDFMSEEEAWLIGRYIADGYANINRNTPRINISVGSHKADKMREITSKLKGKYKIYKYQELPSAVNFVFTSYDFFREIADAGIGSHNKKIPGYVFKLPFKLQKAVLDGYIAGDGHIRKRKNSIEMSAVTTSRELAYGIARLIRNCYHVSASITIKNAYTPINKIRGGDVQRNYTRYNIYSSLTNKTSLSYFDGDILWQPIKEIIKNNGTTTVYNISVLEEHTYAANDIICHNCGAFSSNGGADFREVLNSFVQLIEPEAPSLPMPEEGWPRADIIMGDGFSIAYRTLDAQYWGVPQRRKRIYLVADFRGQRAGKILFESEGLSGYSAEGFRTWQGTAGSIGECPKKSGEGNCLDDRNDKKHGRESCGFDKQEAYGIGAFNSEGMRSDNPKTGFYKADTSRTLDRQGGNPSCNQGGIAIVTEQKINNQEPTYALQGSMIGRQEKNGPQGNGINEEVCFTLNTIDRHAVTCKTEKEEGPVRIGTINEGRQGERIYSTDSCSQTLSAGGGGIGGKTGLYLTQTVVRRLTPTECARLQGFPDNWTDNIGNKDPTDEEIKFWKGIFLANGKNISGAKIRAWLENPYSDSAAYRMWGNGIALPCAVFVLAGIAYYDRLGETCG